MTPGRLWSLLDAMKSFGQEIAQVATLVYSMESLMVSDSISTATANQPISNHNLSQLNWLIARLASLSVRLELDSMEELLNRMDGRGKRGYLPHLLRSDLADVRSRFEDGLAARKLVFVAPKRATLYDAKDLFGERVRQRFPKAVIDIDAAGKCLSLGLGTSTVVHLMRVMEVGLKALAKSLGVAYAPSWESYLRQIETNIGLKRANKTRAWIKREPFYRDISGDLVAVKNAWRNTSMHVVRHYDADEAAKIFDAVQHLMERLADGLPKR